MPGFDIAELIVLGANPVADVAASVGVTWHKLIAQIIIFVVILTVLRLFAFGPIGNILEKRRRTIIQSLEDAEKAKKALAEAEATRQNIIREATDKAREIVEQATKTAEAAGQKKIQEAIAQAEAIIQKAQQAAAADRERMLNELRGELGRLVVATTAKVTGKVLTDDDRRRLVEESVSVLRS